MRRKTVFLVFVLGLFLAGAYYGSSGECGWSIWKTSINIKCYGAIEGDAGDDTAAINSAIAALPAAGGQIFIPSGLWQVSGSGIACNAPVRITGAHKRLTTINVASAATGITITGSCAVEHLLIVNGSIGIDVQSGTHVLLSNLKLEDQTTNYIKVNGDSAAELLISSVYGETKTASVVTATGISYERTTTADIGGVYLNEVLVAGISPGVLTNGIFFTNSNPSPAVNPIFLRGVYVDNASGFGISFLRFTSGIFMSNIWAGVGAGATSSPMIINDSDDVTFQGGRLIDSDGINGNIQIVDGSSNILISGVETVNGNAIVLSGTAPTNVGIFNIMTTGTSPAIASSANLTTLESTGYSMAAIPGINVMADAQFYLRKVTGTPTLAFDAGDAVQYDRNNNIYTFLVGSSTSFQIRADGVIPKAYLFTNLPAATNGTIVYCSDCTFADPCAGAGTGAIAKRLNGAWRCD